MADEARKNLAEAIDQIEAAYEYFLAYAAQGIRNEANASKVGGQLRRHLESAGTALARLPALLSSVLENGVSEAQAELEAFGKVMEADAGRAAVVVDLVRARSSITSQLVDNLNASVHVRTLLTDLFILDEALSLGVDAATEPEASQPVS